MFLWDPSSANKILKEGASILNRCIVPKKPKKEPIRCMRCQRFGHEHHNCTADTTTCGRCANPHETNSCTDSQTPYKCANCKGNHPSYDRECPRFQEKCRQTDGRCPENTLAFYPTSESWTWSTFDHLPPHNSSSPELQRPPPPLSGTNNTPLGTNHNGQQTQQTNPPQ